MTRCNLIYIAIGAGALFLGSLYYAVCRPDPPLLISWFVAEQEIPRICRIQHLGYSFPTFVHVFGFSLISAAFIDRRLGYIIICVSMWFFINVFFEVISLLPITTVENILPTSVAQVITVGTFDGYDIVAAFWGAICAILVIYAYPRVKTKVINNKHNN